MSIRPQIAESALPPSSPAFIASLHRQRQRRSTRASGGALVRKLEGVRRRDRSVIAIGPTPWGARSSIFIIFDENLCCSPVFRSRQSRSARPMSDRGRPWKRGCRWALEGRGHFSVLSDIGGNGSVREFSSIVNSPGSACRPPAWAAESDGSRSGTDRTLHARERGYSRAQRVWIASGDKQEEGARRA